MADFLVCQSILKNTWKAIIQRITSKLTVSRRKIFWKLLLETPACSMISAIVVFRYPCSRKSFTHTCRIRFFVCSLNLVAIGPHLCLLKFQINSSYDSASGLYTKHNRKRHTSSSRFWFVRQVPDIYGLSCFFQTFFIPSISKTEYPKNQTYFL